MSAVLQWSYEKRDPISYVSAMVLVALIVLGLQFSLVNLSKDNDLEMSAFIEHPIEPDVIKPLEPVKKVVEKKEPQKPLPEPTVSKPAPSPFATEAPKEIRHQDHPAPVERQPVVQAPSVTPPPPPAPQPVPPSVAGLYEAQLRAYLEKIKRYPTSREARLTRPQGAVRIWLEISRTGQLLGVGVMSSSGSNLLDGEAIKTLKTGSYPPIPEEAFVGESSHKFSATLSYTLEAQ